MAITIKNTQGGVPTYEAIFVASQFRSIERASCRGMRHDKRNSRICAVITGKS
jgi:hypothetical protein